MYFSNTIYIKRNSECRKAVNSQIKSLSLMWLTFLSGEADNKQNIQNEKIAHLLKLSNDCTLYNLFSSAFL